MGGKKCKLNINSEKETTAVSQLTLDNLKKTEGYFIYLHNKYFDTCFINSV